MESKRVFFVAHMKVLYILCVEPSQHVLIKNTRTIPTGQGSNSPRNTMIWMLGCETLAPVRDTVGPGFSGSLGNLETEGGGTFHGPAYQLFYQTVFNLTRFFFYFAPYLTRWHALNTFLSGLSMQDQQQGTGGIGSWWDRHQTRVAWHKSSNIFNAFH